MSEDKIVKTYDVKCDVEVEGIDELEDNLKKVSALLKEANALIAKMKATPIHARVTSSTEH